MLARGASEVGSAKGSNGAGAGRNSPSRRAGGAGSSCSRRRRQLPRSPRVRRLSRPRWNRPAPRASRKRASANGWGIQRQLRLKGGCGPPRRVDGPGLDSAIAHSLTTARTAAWRCPLQGRRARMARIEYDEDDHDDDGGPGRDWRRTLLTWGLAAVGLGLGFLVPYVVYLDHQVGKRFGQLQWQEPTRVYARPLVLARGGAMDPRTLKLELEAAGYRAGDGRQPGTWSDEDGRWTIASRGFADVDGPVAPSRVEVRLADGEVARVRDLVGERDAARVRLDPARIATLYGRQQEERRLVRVSERSEEHT